MNILIIDTHPFHGSFGQALIEAYEKGAKKENKVNKIVLRDTKFDPLANSNMMVEPVIQEHQKWFLWADHIVIESPIWWGTVPALFKGWIDKTIVHGVFFKYGKGMIPAKLMKGKTVRFIYTLNGPWIYQLITGFVTWKCLNRHIFKFCGFKAKRTPLYSVQFVSQEKRLKMLEKIYQLGLKGK